MGICSISILALTVLYDVENSLNLRCRFQKLEQNGHMLFLHSGRQEAGGGELKSVNSRQLVGELWERMGPGL